MQQSDRSPVAVDLRSWVKNSKSMVTGWCLFDVDWRQEFRDHLDSADHVAIEVL